MLRQLELQQYKCFEELHLPLAALTVLSGTNSSGKSSIIQSIALLSQTFRLREWSRSLMLNAPGLSMGTAGDVLNQETGRDGVAIGLADESCKVRWSFAAKNRRALSMDVDEVKVNGIGGRIGIEPLRFLMPVGLDVGSVVDTIKACSWITAERLGPREILPLLDAESHRRVGSQGELAAGLLHHFEDRQVLPALCLPGSPTMLFHQVRARLSTFFPGCDLRLQPIDGSSAITLRFRASERTEFHRPQNVGFGITQLFPLLVAMLAAAPGDLLLIENPEVHLHPAAQQEIGRLFAVAAAHGIQVIMETHSDHVLNGIRLAVKDGMLNTDVAVHFFRTGSQVVSPMIDADGKLSEWPVGFFDQFDSALSRLM